MAEPPLNLGNIQGNILAGFKQDHQTFLFFQILDAGKGRAWLAETVGAIASSKKVQASNEAFKRAAKRLSDPTSVRRAIWVNVAFTHRGLAAIGAPGLDQFPDEFQLGMRARAKLLGDAAESAPENWILPFRDHDIHGIVLVAADRDADCRAEVKRQEGRLTKHGLKLLYTQRGMTREGGKRGHEHFGFKDGISQPGILGLTDPNNRQDPHQGDPGQDLIQPGEFVLGYRTEQSPPTPPTPAWATDGSYLVFRRLRQDVKSFNDFVSRQARTQGVTSDLLAAKLVGRYKSGAPLERTIDQPVKFDPARSDPSNGNPGILGTARVNNFEYGGDPDGLLVPRSAHIRKVYPRDQVPPGEGEARTRRLLRRGIPYGESLHVGAAASSPRGSNADRGLLFLCYQSSIASQFEFVQRKMVNNADFPQPGDGPDPIISQSTGEFTLPGGVPDHVALMRRWVTTTGGDYFFSPSISALRELSAGHKYTRSGSMEELTNMQRFYKFVAAYWANDLAVTKHPGIADAETAAEKAHPQPTTPVKTGATKSIMDAQAEKARNAITTDVNDVHATAVGSAAVAGLPTGTAAPAGVGGDLAQASNAWTVVLREFDVDVPRNRIIYVHKNTQMEYHYVVPESPATNPATLEDMVERAMQYVMTD